MLHATRLFLVLVAVLLAISSTVVRAGGGGYGDDDDDGNSNYDAGAPLEVCQNSVVALSAMEALCNSPYTFYYGNGANRNSLYCDYGDKSNIYLSFDVVDELSSDVKIYMQMVAYTPGNEELYRGENIDLCALTGEDDCTGQGLYNATMEIQFAYLNGNQTKFVPYFEIAFSSEADGGSNLGGVNIDCDINVNFLDWIDSKTNTTMIQYQTQSFISHYGILIGTVIVLGVFATMLVRQAGDRIEYEGPANSRTAGLMQQQH